MEIPIRRHRPLQDQENLVSRNVAKGGGLKTRSGLTQRGVLGDLSNNLSARTVDVAGKIADTAAEFAKKAIISRGVKSSSYKHVQSKIDTGLSAKLAAVAPVPSARPPLRREESTATHAARALMQKSKATSILPSKIRTKESEAKLQERKSVEKTKGPSLEADRPSRLQSVVEESALASPSARLPPDVEDVDAGDDNSPLLLSIYIKDIYRYLMDMELKYSIRPNHLENQVAVTGRMRATLVDWLVEVQRQFNLLLETFQMTVGIIDRYLQVNPDVPRNRLQLVGVTAMFIACKYEEIYAPDVSDFIFVTDNAYHKKDIFKCERDIIHRLGYCLGRPLPLQFIRRFVKVAEGNSRNHHLAKYFVDLCLVEYSMAHRRPSELAAAAMCLSLHLLSANGSSLEELWTPTLQFYSGYSMQHLRPIVCEIARVVRAAEGGRLKAVRARYSEPALAAVATLPELRGAALRRLADSPPLPVS